MIESLAGNPENVQEFLSHLSENLSPRLKSDYSKMFEMKKQLNSSAKNLEVWDVPYYAMRARKIWFEDLDTEKISEYFSLGVCMEGLNTIFKSLFRVELEVENAEEGELWDSDVYKLRVVDCESRDTLGHIYCDFFSRNGKPYQVCMLRESNRVLGVQISKAFCCSIQTPCCFPSRKS